jgi:hypothetical protein
VYYNEQAEDVPIMMHSPSKKEWEQETAQARQGHTDEPKDKLNPESNARGKYIPYGGGRIACPINFGIGAEWIESLTDAEIMRRSPVIVR